MKKKENTTYCTETNTTRQTNEHDAYVKNGTFCALNARLEIFMYVGINVEYFYKKKLICSRFKNFNGSQLM